MEIIILGLVFLSVTGVFMIVLPWFLFAEQKSKSAENAMLEYDLIRQRSFIGRLRPLLQFVLRLLQSQKICNKWVEKNSDKWEEKLIKAGSPGNVTGEEFSALKVVSPLFVVLFMMLGFEMPISSLYIFFVLFGFILPDIWLNDQIRTRQVKINKVLPDAMDTFALVVSAGLSFEEALDVYVKRSTHNPLMEELAIVRNEQRLGRTVNEALEEMSQRVGSVSLTNFTTMVIQSQKMGTSMGDVLDAQAKDLRGRRFHLAEEMGQKAPIKMVFPLLLFIMPNVFIILFAPMVLKMLYQ